MARWTVARGRDLARRVTDASGCVTDTLCPGGSVTPSNGLRQIVPDIRRGPWLRAGLYWIGVALAAVTDDL